MAKVDLSEFEAEQRIPNRPQCRLGALLGALPEDQRAKLEAALADGLLRHTSIARVLGRWGHRIAPDSVARHRRGQCAC